MKKSSKLMTEVTESRGWWECGTEAFAEWTFEGGLKDMTYVSRSRREPNPLSIRHV